jgi:hypothetical protein
LAEELETSKARRSPQRLTTQMEKILAKGVEGGTKVDPA